MESQKLNSTQALIPKIEPALPWIYSPPMPNKVFKTIIKLKKYIYTFVSSYISVQPWFDVRDIFYNPSLWKILCNLDFIWFLFFLFNMYIS